MDFKYTNSNYEIVVLNNPNYMAFSFIFVFHVDKIIVKIEFKIMLLFPKRDGMQN